MTKKIYNNKNGYLSIKEFVELIHTGEIDQFMRKFQTSKDKCPPYKLISSDTICFYCVECHNQCVAKIKEYKNHYQVGKDKYLKEDISKEELDG